MFVLENDFIISLVVSKIVDFSANGVGASEFEEFLSNLPEDLINALPDFAKYTLGYYFNSYDYQTYSESFFLSYVFVSVFETKYSLFDEVKND